MPVENSPPPSQQPLPSIGPPSVETSVCNICKENITEGDDCLVLNECSHPFHRSCIETFMSTSAECPTCKRSCQPNDLRDLVIQAKNVPISKSNTMRGKGRGALSKHYNTRSSVRNLFQDHPSSSQNHNPNSNVTPSRNTEMSNNIFSPIQLANTSNTIDCNELDKIVEASLTKILQKVNIIPGFNNPNSNSNSNNSNPLNTQAGVTTQQQQTIQNNQRLNSIPSNNNVNISNQQEINGNNTRSNQILSNHNLNLPSQPNLSQNHRQFQPPNNGHQRIDQSGPAHANINFVQNSHFSNLSPNSIMNSNTSNMPLDKITSIIQNWNLKFDGSTNGLNVEEFLYRLGSLTSDYFNGDYSVICRNLNSLLTGKARDWYWRYHKQVQFIEWNSFCDALRNQYKEFKSSFDIREEIRARKQKPNETFDVFFESVSAMMDRLPRPMSEPELIEILARNLRPDIRQELLYVPIHSISHLRRLVQMRENFFSDEYVRKSLPNRNSAPFQISRRNLAEIATEITSSVENTDHVVEALQKPEHISTCWNCDMVGHHWQDCIQDRTIFCYGCGAKNTYKPNCMKCTSRKQNISKNLKNVCPQMDKI